MATNFVRFGLSYEQADCETLNGSSQTDQHTGEKEITFTGEKDTFKML